jgi:hypothetical protein
MTRDLSIRDANTGRDHSLDDHAGSAESNFAWLSV